MAPAHTWTGKSDYAQITEAFDIVDAAASSRSRTWREPYLLIGLDLPPAARKGPLPLAPGAARLCTTIPRPPVGTDGNLPYRIHRPDLAVSPDDTAAPCLLIELDGSWHDSRAGRAQTDRRDADYAEAGLKCIALRLSEYPVPGDWQAELRRRLARLPARPCEAAP